MKKQRRLKRKGNLFYIYFIYFLVFCILLLLSINFFKSGDVKGIKTSPYVTSYGTQLVESGKIRKFVGYNAFQSATLPGYNVGCGSYVSNIDEFFSTLPSNSMIRIWGWQGSMAINPKTKELDWSGIDRVLAAAEKYNQKVIVSLGNQSGQCDDGQWKDSSWYAGGFKQVYNPSGFTPLSYWDFVQRIVKRYKNSKVIAMWELINEPETSDCSGFNGVACYGHQICQDHTKAAKILRLFFDKVGERIKTIDHNHLVESGLIGTGQCGSDNNNYVYLHQSPVVDVASYHDYNDDDSPIPGDQWNGLAVRLKQMESIDKPIIIGELGMLASQNGKNCLSFNQRATKIQAKMDAMFANGVAEIFLWDRTPGESTECNFDIGDNDPLVSIINSYKLH
jgi:hypothetical protein